MTYEIHIISVKESETVFLYIRGHNITQRTPMHTFGHLSETFSKKFHDKCYCPCFKRFISEVDGTHLPITIY